HLARLGNDRAPAETLGDARRRASSGREPVLAGKGAAPGYRADGFILGGGRQPHDHRAELHRRCGLGLTNASCLHARWPAARRELALTRLLTLAVPAAIVFALVAYAIAAHLVFASQEGTRLVALFAWAPLAVTALWLLWGTSYLRGAVVVVAAVTAALLILWPEHGMDVGLVYLGQYVVAQVCLGALFGRT